MNTFIIDLTHGGVKIAIELSKLAKKLKDNENNSEYTLYETIYAYDLYNTLKEEDKLLLQVYNIIILKELLDLFIQNGLLINDDLKRAYTEEELQTLFKEHFDMWHIGLSELSHTMYIDLAEQTKAIYDKIAE